MEKQQKRGARHNAELVDALFEMMFETLWASPTTRWRNVEAFKSFEECARRVVVLLNTTNLATANTERLAQLSKGADDLLDNVTQLADTKLILHDSAVKSTALILRLKQVLADVVNACAAGTPSK